MSKESETKIKMMRNFIIKELKEADWEKSYNGIKSQHLKIYDSNDHTMVEFDNDSHSLSNFINIIHYYILYLFYTRKSVKNSEEMKNKRVLARSVDRFFDRNKGILRDQKLDEIL